MQAADVFTKLDLELRPDPSRTVLRPFSFGYPDAFAAGRVSRAQAVVDRIAALDGPTRDLGEDHRLPGAGGQGHRGVLRRVLSPVPLHRVDTFDLVGA